MLVESSLVKDRGTGLIALGARGRLARLHSGFLLLFNGVQSLHINKVNIWRMINRFNAVNSS